MDLLVMAEGDLGRRRRLAMDLSEAAALAEDESPFTHPAAASSSACYAMLNGGGRSRAQRACPQGEGGA